jgi:hypothetical protein
MTDQGKGERLREFRVWLAVAAVHYACVYCYLLRWFEHRLSSVYCRDLLEP